MPTVNNPSDVTSHAVNLTGLTADTDYSYRVRSQDPTGLFSPWSNWRTFSTLEEEPSGGGAQLDGIWISRTGIMSFSNSSSSFNNILNRANSSWGSATGFADNSASHHQSTLAGAIVAVRNNSSSMRSKAYGGIDAGMSQSSFDSATTAPARALACYIWAADILNIRVNNVSLHNEFSSWLNPFLSRSFGGDDIRDVARRRPNNIGMMALMSNLAGAIYLNRTSEVNELYNCFQGWLGDLSKYPSSSSTTSGAYVYNQGNDWQADKSNLRGINHAGATLSISGGTRNVDGVLPDDQRRSSFTWPPPQEDYVWLALGGAVATCIMFERSGRPCRSLRSNALRRAGDWLYSSSLGNNRPPSATGTSNDVAYVPPLNFLYGRNPDRYSQPSTSAMATAGHAYGWTDWTHQNTLDEVLGS